MERESEYLLHLLGAYLRNAEPQIRQDVDWQKLVRLAYIHNVTGILGYMSMSWPICPEAQMKTYLRGVCLNTMAVCSRRMALADALIARLNEAEIDHIPMKGYVLRDYYPVPELRTFGDIDIVIRPEDREKSHGLMLSLGYRAKTDWEPVFSYIKEGECYELHTRIMEVNVSEKADHQAYFRQMWRYARKDGSCSWRFTPEYHFLYMLAHLAKHVTGSGAGVRLYLDVAALVRHFGKTLDWAFVEQELKKLCLGDFANVALTMVRDCFGIESPLPLKPVAEEMWDSFMEFTMEGGVFGRSGRDSGTVSLKAGGHDQSISRAGTFTRRLFPSARTIEKRYTYLQDKPWLLPAAWVHRFFKTKATWQLHAKEVRNIMTADKHEALRIRKLYEDIGL